MVDALYREVADFAGLAFQIGLLSTAAYLSLQIIRYCREGQRHCDDAIKHCDNILTHCDELSSDLKKLSEYAKQL